MKLLILGGTQFVGRVLTEYALKAGHKVTLFNRGKTNPGLFRQVEEIHGDRDGGLDALKGRQWDVVIDISGYVPRIVGQSAELLSGATDLYVFISTMATVETETLLTTPGVDESAPTRKLDDPTTEDINGETYGGLKVLCEQEVQKHFPESSLIIRPGYIAGRYDHTDRFTYWPVRTSRGGEMLTPPLDSLLQVIDIRDLAAWTLHMAEDRKPGLYNAVGPSVTYERILKASQEAAGEFTADLIPASEAFLLEQEMEGSDLPLWFSSAKNGIMQVSNQHALNDGLRLHDIEATVQDTLAWYREVRGIDDPLRTGLSAEKEQTTIAAWKAATSE